MNDITNLDAEGTEELLSALGEQLAAAGSPFELVVIGGSALLALGLVDRPTNDVDVVALADGDSLVAAEPLPPALVAARNRVARDFNLPDRWLNPGPTSLLDFGLPKGFLDRVTTRTYGEALTVHFDPTKDELLAAATWAQEHDPSIGFAESLRDALSALGVEGAGRRS